MLLTVVSATAKGIALTPAEQLLQRLAKIQKQGIMYAHQDDPFYGITWQWERDRSDTKDLTGDYPAVMGFDLGGIELASDKNLDGVPFEWMREEIQAQHRRGGIVTLSWHPRNPLLGTSAWIEADTVVYNQTIAGLKALHQDALAAEVINPKSTVASVLPGGAKYDTFQLWLYRVAEYMATLTDDKGELIPIIFRPYHENNGSWFWWGQKLCTDEEWHALWDMTQDFIAARLPENLVWSYSPNLQGNWTEEAWLARYPGDDRIQLIGEDAYQWGTEEAFKAELDADLKVITKIAAEHGKLIAMTECGHQNSPDATWWTRVFKPIIEKYPVCYFLPWRNWHADHFGFSPDAKTAEDSKAWAASKELLLLNDIKKIK